jgi:hypothetical protein
MMRGREKGGGQRMLNVTLGLRFFLFILAFFFLSAGMVEPVWFSSIQSVSNFGNRNRIEPELFCYFLIG